MRNLVVMALVGLASMGGIAVPFIGLLAYIWFGLMRPDAIAYSGPNRYSMILAACTLLGSMRLLSNVTNILRDPFSRGFLFLQVPLLLSVVFALDVDLALVKYIPFLQMTVMLLLIPIVVETIDQLRWLYLVVGFSIGFLGFKFGLGGLLAGGVHYEGGIQGFHSDNNTLALGLAMGVPLCYEAVRMAVPFWAKLIFGSFAFTSIATIFMTQSRGGILALGVVLLFIAWSSPHRVRAFVILAVLSLPVPVLMWDSFAARMSTLKDPLEEGSAAGRWRLNVAAVEIIRDYPILGVGFGADNYAAISSKYLGYENVKRHVVHNNYLQMWTDSGILAFGILCALLFGGIHWLGAPFRRRSAGGPDAAAMARGLRLALVAFAIDSTFTSRTNYDFIYILLFATGCLYRLTATDSLQDSVSVAMPAFAPAPSLPAPATVSPAATLTSAAAANPEPPRLVGLGRALRRAGEGWNGRR